MKFMMLMIPAVYQGGKTVDPNFVPDPKKVEEMGRFNDEMGKTLRIESLNGLHRQITGARVSFGQGKPTVTDGPYIESKEVLGGYWMVEASSKEEVVKWAQRCPAEPGDTIEIRQIFEAADFAMVFGPLTRVLPRLAQQQRDAVRRALEEFFAGHLTPEAVTLRATFWIVQARA